MKKIACLLLALSFATGMEGHRFYPLETSGTAQARKIYQVQQDTTGFLWFYSQTGVLRYDGSQLRRYDIPSDVQSGTTMTTDRAGTLWIGLRNGQIYRYDASKDRFDRILDLDTTRAGRLLYCLTFDGNNRLWIGTDEGAFLYRDGVTETAGISGHRVNTILMRPDEGMLFGTESGIFSIDRNGVPISPPAGRDINVTALYADGGTVLAGTFSSGVFTLDGKVIIRTEAPVRCILRHQDEIIVATDGDGLYTLDPTTLRIKEHAVADIDREGTLIANTVTDLCTDKWGELWVVTSTDGICRTMEAIPHSERIHHQRGNPQSLDSDHVNVVFEDSGSCLWFGTNNSVNRYDSASGTWTRYPGGPNAEGTVVLALAEDSEGCVWAGGYGFPVFRIDPAGRILTVPFPSLSYVYAILSDGDSVWLGGMDSPLVRYDLKTHRAEEFPFNFVGDIAASSDGKLYLATTDGLGILNRDSGECRLIKHFGDIHLQHPIRCLNVAPDGTLYLATDGQGLIHYDPLSEASTSYTTENGLSYNSVGDVIVGPNGYVYLTAEDQIYCIMDGKIVNINGLIGFDCGYFNPNAGAVLKDGTLLFGTAEGAVRFDLTTVGQDFDTPITPILTDLTLLQDGTTINIASAGGDIDLSYRENSFSVGFTALSFNSRHRLRFEYRLAGFEDAWIGAEQAGTAEFRQVGPGHYTFQVRCIDRYSARILGETSASIRIRRPLWLTGWAYLLYALILGVLTAQFIQLRRRRKAETFAQEKIDSFISFAHDIKTPVTLIKAPLSEIDASDALPQQSRESLKVARRNTDRLMEMINSLLELRDAAPGTDGLQLSTCPLPSWIENHLDDYYPAARSKGIDLVQDVEEGLDSVLTDIPKLDMILDNLLSNALKYTRSGQISIRARRSGQRWILEVEDTGIGIPPEARRHLFRDTYRAENALETDSTGYGMGLVITRQLVRRLKGSIRFENGAAGGTVFILSFPLRYKLGKSVHLLEPPAETDVPARDGTAVPDNTRQTLLLVEDDREMLGYLSTSLGQQYNIITADNGLTALALAGEQNPDIVITDVVMPQLTGDELCRRIKGSIETSHIPVILLTAMGEKENIIFGLEAGADDYIVKPFDMAVLRARIRNILQRRSLLQKAIVTENIEEAGAEFVNRLDKEFIEKVQSVINTHLADTEFQVNDLCRELAMSRTAFFNKLKSLTGQGPNDYIRILRLNRAKDLLLTREFTIAEVSDQVGFSDPKYFSVCFKKQFGQSPSRL